MQFNHRYVIPVRQAPTGSIIEMIDYRYGSPVLSGRYYKIASPRRALSDGRIKCISRFGGGYVYIFPLNSCRVVQDWASLDIEGF